MESFNILLTVMISGFTLNFVILGFIWNGLNKRIDRLEGRIDKLGEKITDIDRRLCRIEGSLATQGHCLFGQRDNEKKAEYKYETID